MRILVAEDEPVARALLVAQLTRLGHDVEAANDGAEAWERFQAGPVECVVTDWMMPRMDGLELCRRIRAASDRPWTYVMLLTSREGRESLIEGLEAGADEFMSKPPDPPVMRARLQVAQRLLTLERSLRERVASLEHALAEVARLRGILPICMYCKRIQDGPDAWKGIELYVSERSDATFTHGICPSCYERERKAQLGPPELGAGPGGTGAGTVEERPPSRP